MVGTHGIIFSCDVKSVPVYPMHFRADTQCLSLERKNDWWDVTSTTGHTSREVVRHY